MPPSTEWGMNRIPICCCLPFVSKRLWDVSRTLATQVVPQLGLLRRIFIQCLKDQAVRTGSPSYRQPIPSSSKAQVPHKEN